MPLLVSPVCLYRRVMVIKVLLEGEFLIKFLNDKLYKIRKHWV